MTVTTGTTALVWLFANSTIPVACVNSISFAVSGATTLAASDTNGVSTENETGISGVKVALSGMIYVTGLTAGSNTFTMKYKQTNGVAGAVFSSRTIGVLPL